MTKFPRKIYVYPGEEDTLLAERNLAGADDGKVGVYELKVIVRKGTKTFFKPL